MSPPGCVSPPGCCDMPGDDPVAAELRALRAEVAGLRAALRRADVPPARRYIWLKLFIHDLETNPHKQFTVHKWGAFYWLINFPLVTLLFFAAPMVWLRWGLYVTLIYSIYANLATDYGSMSAAMAAYGEGPLPEVPLEPGP